MLVAPDEIGGKKTATPLTTPKELNAVQAGIHSTPSELGGSGITADGFTIGYLH
jgi:hypothetical protein